MNEIDELKNIWEQNKTNDKFMSAEEFIKKNLREDLKLLEGSQKRLVLIKGIGLLFGLTLMLVSLFHLNSISTFTKSFFIAFALISLVFYLFYAFNRFKIDNENYLLPIQDFINLTLRRLLFEKKFVRIYLPVYLVVPLLLINALMLDADKELELSKIILYHSAITVIFAFFLLLLRKVRITRFDKQFYPLIEKLEKIKGEKNGNE